MQTSIIDNRLKISFDDSFHVLSEAELKQLKTNNGVPDWCIKDENLHIIMSISSKKVNGLALKMLKTKEMAKKMEATLKKPMKAYNYQFDEWISKDLDQEQSEGYNYHYLVQGIEMSGTSLVVKKDKTVYYIYAYYRTALKDDSIKIVNTILDSLNWI